MGTHFETLRVDTTSQGCVPQERLDLAFPHRARERGREDVLGDRSLSCGFPRGRGRGCRHDECRNGRRARHPQHDDRASSKLATSGPKPEQITPPEPAKIQSAIDRGIKFLLDDQRPDGSWGSPENTKGLNIYAPPPGSHDAFNIRVTSLA